MFKITSQEIKETEIIYDLEYDSGYQQRYTLRNRDPKEIEYYRAHPNHNIEYLEKLSILVDKIIGPANICDWPEELIHNPEVNALREEYKVHH